MHIFTDRVALPCFIDFEASALDKNSYPIEVAWSLPSEQVRCYLIRPTQEWAQGAVWDEAAERLHGISFASLEREGRDPTWLCEQMNTQLNGQTVFCDGFAYDLFWLQRLFEVATDPPKFTLASLQEYCYDLGLGARQYEILSKKARQRAGGKAHRADVDVRYLIELYRMA